jgi:hypothetical protein
MLISMDSAVAVIGWKGSKSFSSEGEAKVCLTKVPIVAVQTEEVGTLRTMQSIETYKAQGITS